MEPKSWLKVLNWFETTCWLALVYYITYICLIKLDADVTGDVEKFKQIIDERIDLVLEKYTALVVKAKRSTESEAYK